MAVDFIHQGNLEVSGSLKRQGQEVLTIEPLVEYVSSAASVAPTSDKQFLIIGAQAEALSIENPTGTWFNGQSFEIRIKDDGFPRNLTFSDGYRAIGVALPSATIANQLIYLKFIYDANDNKWDVVGVNIEGATSGSSFELLSDFQSPYQYCGYAPSGSSPSANVWVISRITINLNGTTITQTASNVAWSDRYIIIYT